MFFLAKFRLGLKSPEGDTCYITYTLHITLRLAFARLRGEGVIEQLHGTHELVEVHALLRDLRLLDESCKPRDVCLQGGLGQGLDVLCVPGLVFALLRHDVGSRY